MRSFAPFLSSSLLDHNHLDSVWLLPAAGTLPTCFRRIPWQHDSEWTGRDTPLAQLRTTDSLNRKRTLRLHRMCGQFNGRSGEKSNLASTDIDDSPPTHTHACTHWLPVSVSRGLTLDDSNFSQYQNKGYLWSFVLSTRRRFRIRRPNEILVQKEVFLNAKAAVPRDTAHS